MTDHNREEREALIEKVATMIASHFGYKTAGLMDKNLADQIVTVFEQAHTPAQDAVTPEPSAEEPDLPNGHAPVEHLPQFLARRVQGEPSDERMVIYANSNVTRGKFAAAAVHAALQAVGAHHGGPVIVLGAKPSEIEKHATVIRDAGKTEVEPGTVTAGTDFRRPEVPEPSVEEWAKRSHAAREKAIARGYTPDHDAEHGIRHLLNWAIDYARRGRAEDSSGLILSALALLDEEPQAEPTDAQVEDGCRAFYEEATDLTSWRKLDQAHPDLADNYRGGMVAALRAALKAGGEGR